jgi:hypothetical protein
MKNLNPFLFPKLAIPNTIPNKLDKTQGKYKKHLYDFIIIANPNNLSTTHFSPLFQIYSAILVWSRQEKT